MDSDFPSLEDGAPLKRYHFDLACKLQQLLGEETETFSNNSAFWDHFASNVRREMISELQQTRAPLLSCIVAQALGTSVESKMNAGHTITASEQDLLRKVQVLEKIVAAKTSPRLLEIANSDKHLKHDRATATKLLIHFGTNEQLEQIRHLNEMDFQSEPLGEMVLQRLKYVGCLESLNLAGTFFPSEALRHLAFLPRLKKLNLQGTRAYNNAIVHLSASPSLELLDLSDTPVTDDGARHLLSFKRLNTVNVTGTTISAEMIALLKEAKLNVIME